MQDEPVMGVERVVFGDDFEEFSLDLIDVFARGHTSAV